MAGELGSVGPSQDREGACGALFSQDAQSLARAWQLLPGPRPALQSFSWALSALRLLLWPQHRRIATPGNSPRSGSVRTPVLASQEEVLGHVLGTASQAFPAGSTCSYPLRWLALSKSICRPLSSPNEPSSFPTGVLALPDKLLAQSSSQAGVSGDSSVVEKLLLIHVQLCARPGNYDKTASGAEDVCNISTPESSDGYS